MQEKEPRQLRVDRNAVDPGRELGFFGAAHDQAGLSVVLRRIDDAEGDAVHLLQAGWHVAEVVLALAGPAGSVTVVAETAVRLLREVDRIFAPFRNRPVHRAELKRHDLFVRFAAGEHVVEDVSQVSRSRAVPAPERGRVELRPEDAPLADQGFQNRVFDILAADIEQRDLFGALDRVGQHGPAAEVDIVEVARQFLAVRAGEGGAELGMADRLFRHSKGDREYGRLPRSELGEGGLCERKLFALLR